MNNHDPLCPNIPCDCEQDEYGHMIDCSIYCLCELINKVHERGYKEAEEFYTNECMNCGYAGEWSTWICDECERNHDEKEKDS